MIAGTTNCSSPDLSTGEHHSRRAPHVEDAHSNNLKITITPRTASVPRGKIITDNYRGTTFWEVAESSDDETAPELGPVEKHWSLPFQVEWISKYAPQKLFWANV
jgi:hypothetical protein